MNKKTLLLIMDGVGVAPQHSGNAVTESIPKNLIKLWEANPHTYLEASDEYIGLPKGTNGNSEVGHLTIGAGKINYQNLLKINKAIKKGSFYYNTTLQRMVVHAQKNSNRIHLMGCLSDGGVHCHIEHFRAVLRFLQMSKFQGKVFLHIFTDGRDVGPKTAGKYIEELEKMTEEFNIGEISTICGRAYAMDRNFVLERTQKAYDLLTWGKGRTCKDWREAISKAYNNDEIDEYIEPSIINPEATIQDNDAVLFMNFRPDRAIQLTKALKNLINGNFKSKNIKDIFFVGMVEYEKNFPEKIVFPKEYIALPIGRIISDAGYRQLRISESQKFPHVTYFMNGGLPIQYAGEDRVKIPSADVATYDLKPEMSAFEVMNALLSKLDKKHNYRFICVNLANGDMVGHTGNLKAGIKAMETVDYVAGKIVRAAQMQNWTVVITADHGNVERMVEPETGEMLTEHTRNPVPFLIASGDDKLLKNRKLKTGTLSDIAPTILKLMGLEKPAPMTGQNLIS